MKTVSDFTDEELKQIGLLAVRYMYAFNDYAKSFITNPNPTLRESCDIRKPKDNLHGELEIAILRDYQ